MPVKKNDQYNFDLKLLQIILFSLHFLILYFMNELKQPRFIFSSDPNEEIWIGLTCLVEVFTKCDSVLLLLIQEIARMKLCADLSPNLPEESNKSSTG